MPNDTTPAAMRCDVAGSFQARVDEWLIACFGEEIARDKVERNHRFIEEALELVQTNGCTRSEAHQLVDYVFSRPIGDPKQEVGGVRVTFAALCLASDLDMDECGEVELARVWTKVEQIRAKQAAKPKHSPLPESVPDRAPAAVPVAELQRLRDKCRDEGSLADDLAKGERAEVLSDVVGELDALLARAGTAEAAGGDGWLPIESALHDEDEDVLLGWIDWPNCGRWVQFVGSRRRQATHWRPLPLPPTPADPARPDGGDEAGKGREG